MSFVCFFLFWVFGSGFRRLGRIWVAFGWRLGGVWVGVGWLDLGSVAVIFSDGFDGGFRCLLGLFGQRVVVAWW